MVDMIKNESYTFIEYKTEKLLEIHNFLKTKKHNHHFDPQIQMGFKSKYDYYSFIEDNKLFVYNGHLQLLKHLIPVTDQINNESDFKEQEIKDFFNEQTEKHLPFKPYTHQEKAFIDTLLHNKQISKLCTGSGKSLIISFLLLFFLKKNKKGVLIVPNINLLEQFKSDIADYNLTEILESMNILGGGYKDFNENKPLTLSTWQTLSNNKDSLENMDFLICDEVHKFTGDETSDIILKSTNCKHKYGFTGTIPEIKYGQMMLLGLFHRIKTYITSAQLIELGLGCPIKINAAILKYSDDICKDFNDIKVNKARRNHKLLEYQLKTTFIKELPIRNNFILNLTAKIKTTGNTLVLFSHTEHGKQLYRDCMKRDHANVEIDNKDITGRKSFEFQNQYKIFFLNGENDKKTKEAVRKILETYDDAVIFSNYAILSTGVDIKKLHNLVFATPLKSFTTITQSVGRLIRKHESKKIANVYDIVDNFDGGMKKGTFYNQFKQRKKIYTKEEFDCREKILEIG